MKSTFALLAVLAALLLSHPASAAEPQTLRVLCYNIHYGQGTDGNYDVARLAKVILKEKPDLVALQEVDVGVKRSGRVHEARRLAELTGMAVRFGPTQHYEGGLFGNAVLTKLPVLDVHIQPLPYTEATPEKVTYPRGAIAVTLKSRSGKPFRFISTHFQHNVAEDRLAEAKAINRHFAGEDDSMPTILAGDMNATPDSEPIKTLLSRWKNATDEPAAPSAPSRNPRSRIDYIFYRAAPHLKLTHAEVIAEEVASDHRPVLAVFEILPR
jgi:endonuclease/exonuclease/phosphatase family metal-dependent hydrolase